MALAMRADQGENYDGSMSAGYYFYDLNGKISHTFSDKDRLYLSVYMGDDAIYAHFRSRYREDTNRKMTENMKLDWDWGNIVASTRWNHVINNRLFMNSTIAYTRYRFNL